MSTLTDREYDAELHRLHDQILVMGAKVEEMIASSMKALTERDSELARRMIEFDHQINRMEVETDELCLRILAKRQPVASDLRLITIALKLTTDLERIGDLGVNMCERIIELNMEPPLKPYVGIPRMAETVQAMIRDALDAFVSADPGRAREVMDRDRIVDAYYAQIFRELLTYMMEDTHNIYRAIRAQSIAKYLERIGDHATNLAEMVIFMVMGKDVRHLVSMAGGAQRRPRGILFMCVHNSARSQMAEALARRLLPAGVRVLSAGSQPVEKINPYAVRAMQEIGLDISGHQPRGVADIPWGDVDMVVTVCAEEACVVPAAGMIRESWNLPDPSEARGGDEQIMAAFRGTRDQLQEKVGELIAEHFPQ
jgi:phosphate transport system protein